MKKIVILLLFVSNTLLAQSVQSLFTTANNLYKEGKYAEAVETYQKIAKKDSISADLYYNLGNAYYKLNKVAPAIYNYEKALKIDPLYKDARNNLVFAKRLTLDNIEELPTSFLQRLESNFLHKFSYNQWAIATVIFSFLASVLFLLFYFAEIPMRKRLYFLSSMLSFLLLIISFFITLKEYHYTKNNKEAIIFAPKAIVKNEPTMSANGIFTLHEGTKVKILDAVDNWKKIKLADGKIGWMISDELKEF